MSFEKLIDTILEEMPDLNKWKRDFLAHNFKLQCQLRGRHNFLNMARYGGKNESNLLLVVFDIGCLFHDLDH